MNTVKQAHNELVEILRGSEAVALAELIRVGQDDIDAERETAAVKQIRAITHEIYFRATGFSNSRGREYLWIFALTNAARAAEKNSPEKIGKYLTAEEAVHWLNLATAEVRRLLDAVRGVTA